MPNFRKTMYPQYKAHRKPPARLEKVRIVWERTSGGAVGAIESVETGWDMHVYSCDAMDGTRASNAPHVVTAGLISLCKVLGYDLCNVEERVPAVLYPDLDAQGF